MTVGSQEPPRGFDKSHKLKEVFTNGIKGDHYWQYHHFEGGKETPVIPFLTHIPNGH